MCNRVSTSVSSFATSAAFILVGLSAHAQDQSLQGQANDRSPSLLSFQSQNCYSPSRQNCDVDRQILQFRAAIPLQIYGVNNIAFLALLYATDTASGKSGFQDITITNLATFGRSWERFGIAFLPTGSSDLRADKWGLKPAFESLAHHQWGHFALSNRRIFKAVGDGDPDASISTPQPLLTVWLGNGWSVETSDMIFAYDWEADEFTSPPLVATVSKLPQVGNLATRIQLS